MYRRCQIKSCGSGFTTVMAKISDFRLTMTTTSLRLSKTRCSFRSSCRWRRRWLSSTRTPVSSRTPLLTRYGKVPRGWQFLSVRRRHCIFLGLINLFDYCFNFLCVHLMPLISRVTAECRGVPSKSVCRLTLGGGYFQFCFLAPKIHFQTDLNLTRGQHIFAHKMFWHVGNPVTLLNDTNYTECKFSGGQESVMLLRSSLCIGSGTQITAVIRHFVALCGTR